MTISAERRSEPPKLHIPVVAGVGEAPTELAAFDAALMAAGVANFNLVTLSSVIPPASVVTPTEGPVCPPGEWGDRLYVVLAEARTSQRGDHLAAGIGWVQEAATGRGLFVEHHGHSADEVQTLVHESLGSLVRTRDGDFGEVCVQLATATCDGMPVSALVVAVFESASWARGT